jgi:hypothetical protein
LGFRSRYDWNFRRLYKWLVALPSFANGRPVNSDVALMLEPFDGWDPTA